MNQESSTICVNEGMTWELVVSSYVSELALNSKHVSAYAIILSTRLYVSIFKTFIFIAYIFFSLLYVI
jgi:hypothetical protein